MNAIAALRSASANGIYVALEGTDLILDAALPPPQDVVDALKCNKAEIIALLWTEKSCWSHEEWLAFFDERAAIVEFDGGLPRDEAERMAYEECVNEWLRRHPVNLMPEVCHACRDAENSHDPLLPYSNSRGGYVWVHERCWPWSRLESAWQWRPCPSSSTASGIPG
jgi:hypothetical protein